MKRMNLVNDMNEAWRVRNEVDHDKYEEYFKNLISYTFVRLEEIYMDYCKNKGITYNGETFYAIQDIIVFIIGADDDILNGEYDAYVRYCNWAGVRALSVSELRSLISRLDQKTVVNDICLVDSIRENTDPEVYSKFVLGLCFLSLMGDKAFDENEYYLISSFYRSDYDYCPETWEQFKKEWV